VKSDDIYSWRGLPVRQTRIEMTDPPSLRKLLLSGCWLVSAFCTHTTLAADRQWYRLSIDGDRVGYAWRDRVLESGEYIDSEVARVELEEHFANAKPSKCVPR